MLNAMMFGKFITRFLVLTSSLFLSKCALAQTGNTDLFLNSLNNAYVKSIDEFIARFNAEEFHPGIYYDDENNLRTRSLLSLIDWQRFQVEDSIISHLEMSFSDSVCWNDILLNIESGDIYAEAKCIFEYKQQNIPISIIFTYENIRDDFYKWAMTGVNGLFESRFVDTNRNGYINPIQHELHFSDLKSACESDLTRFVSVDKPIDQLSFFLGMMKTGQMKFISCNNVLFHFTQVPYYIFVVGKANRLSHNSGYLIQSLFRMEESQKRDYIKQLSGF